MHCCTIFNINDAWSPNQTLYSHLDMTFSYIIEHKVLIILNRLRAIEQINILVKQLAPFFLMTFGVFHILCQTIKLPQRTFSLQNTKLFTIYYNIVVLKAFTT